MNFSQSDTDEESTDIDTSIEELQNTEEKPPDIQPAKADKRAKERESRDEENTDTQNTDDSKTTVGTRR